jgi:membrane fusion protein, heavy metal efflux system
MTPKECRKLVITFVAIAAVALSQAGCGNGQGNSAMGAPPPAQVIHEENSDVVQVDHREQFPTVAATQYAAASQLTVTASVSPDISRTVPVVSLASGRVVDIQARLGDVVKKGQILLRVRSDDVASGFSDYRKAVADEALANTQLTRSKELYSHGAISLNDLQVAQDTEDKAKVDLQTSAEHLRLLGTDPSHPTGIVDIPAPISGVITDQQVLNAGGVQGLSSPNPFTISDLSHVWVLCDVYENDLPNVRLGETADVRLTAYPGQVLKGTIGNIGSILDPSIHTAKVRIEVRNPGFMRPGMFATATFHGLKKETHTAVPAAAILHLHDQDWVYEPVGNDTFRRIVVKSGATLANQMQEILSGLQPGQKVVANALALENTVENQ